MFGEKIEGKVKKGREEKVMEWKERVDPLFE